MSSNIWFRTRVLNFIGDLNETSTYTHARNNLKISNPKLGRVVEHNQTSEVL